ncbi:hypothetical protein [Massilia sp. TS11]|uniref:hypothetical protein n=1 Tax=Massilia sp. TS11 TaxID=2908003 RepID=UPI001EDC2051|nr:hypothetical protein [Massilia sp. TS11]MCG2583284.1 hypothetical protein [Massilia sp. TS11]
MKTAAQQSSVSLPARGQGRQSAWLLLALLSASLPSWAEPGRDERQPPQRQEAARERPAPRQDNPPPQRAERQPPPQQQQPQPDVFRRDGRLTPDERGDLRRQIKEAGQELYQSQPQRR